MYALLLDRTSLSKMNKWINSNDEVFVIFSREDAMKKLKISKNTATSVFKELKKHELIHETLRGFNQTKIIYVGKVKENCSPSSLTPNNRDSRIPKNKALEPQNMSPNNTNINYPDFISTL